MRVVILHQEVGDGARADELDVLDQVRAVGAALVSLGHEAMVLPLPDDLEAGAEQLSASAPGVVFNLVESLCGQGRLTHLAPALLDRRGLAYTGSGASATQRAASKLLTKQALRAAGLPTPPWFTLDELRAGAAVPPGRYLLKSVWEHGSLGLDGDAVVDVDVDGAGDGAGGATALLRALEDRLPCLGGEGFAEAYVPGREFNLALLEGASGPECLPPAEIRFAGYQPGEPRIVGYRAKWSPGSAEDRRTPRSFEFEASDTALLERLRHLALLVWEELDLGGYARVDFRVDADREPQIVDVNTNPCLSPDAGFAATLARAGVEFEDAVGRILDAALGRRRLRDELLPGDEARVRGLVASTGFFSDEEIGIAVELVAERRARGDDSGYHFLFLEVLGEVAGYSCYGPIPATQGSHDLYWIAVAAGARRQGHGRYLLRATEKCIARQGGRLVWVDTSSRAQYAPTRAFYEGCGYRRAATLADFYRPGDDKVIYCKALGQVPPPGLREQSPPG